MAIMQHRRATATSMLQNGISRNTKCDIMVGFPKSSYIYASAIYNLTLPKAYRANNGVNECTVKVFHFRTVSMWLHAL